MYGLIKLMAARYREAARELAAHDPHIAGAGDRI